MKFVAVSQRVTSDTATGERRDALDQRWFDFFSRCDMFPVLLPNFMDFVSTIMEDDVISALILTGGNSLAKYGGDAPERDMAEKLAIDIAIKREIPVLGICRGMQVLQDYFGIKLSSIDGNVKPKQTITINGNDCVVNSYHEFGTEESTKELIVWARGKDNIVKAIRHDRYPVLGIMWHPERLNPFRSEDIQLFNDVIQGVT